MILHGDCLEQMRTLDANSVDSIVTDPPAGISFMNKSWDGDKGGRDHWINWLTEIMTEAKRVLKPGGHALVWSIPRTSHWTGMALENAGFEVRDCVTHIFGSGFPKSMDVSKAIDKQAGAEREVIGAKERPGGFNRGVLANSNSGHAHQDDNGDITAPATDAAKQWQGWGTALKPAVENWWLIRKPLEAKLTVAQNVLKYGTGALNIDTSRVGDEKMGGQLIKKSYGADESHFGGGEKRNKEVRATESVGRWPANVILDEEAGQALDAQSGNLAGRGSKLKNQKRDIADGVTFGLSARPIQIHENNGGGASRFFYCAKSSKRERGEGNVHPTVKPISLMSYLIKLVTPPGGTVLDPFMGSGSTLVAAKSLGFKFIGCELNQEYVEIAEKRIEAVV